MDTIVITPRSKKDIPFLKDLLSRLSDVKHIEVVPSSTANKNKLHDDIDLGLKEIKEILEGKKQTKSFEQYINEI